MTIELTVAIARAEFVAGESLPLRITLTNRGTFAAKVPDPKRPLPFEFGLVDAVTQAPRYSLSALRAHIDRYDDPRRRPASFVDLEPGASRVYDTDLMKFTAAPLRLGRYALTVRWREGGAVIEPAVPSMFALVPARASRVAAHMSDATRRFSAVMVHVGATDMTLYQRESAEARPGDGIWYARTALPPVKSLSVATAIDAYDNDTGRRWSAWLQDDAVGAIVCEGTRLVRRFDPVPIELHGPALFPWGWQPSERSASFLVGGTGADGGTVLAWVAFHAGAQPSVVYLPLGPVAPPDLWCAHAFAGGAGVVVDVVLAYVQDGVTTLVRVIAHPERGLVDPLVTIASHPEALAALRMDPASRDAVPHVDALFGPSGHDGKMLLTRIAIDGSATLGAWTFTAPQNDAGNRPTLWGLGPTSFADPVVVAFLTPQALARRVSDVSWSSVGRVSSNATHLHVFDLRGAPWALWWDQDPGIVIKALFVPDEDEAPEPDDEGDPDDDDDDDSD